MTQVVVDALGLCPSLAMRVATAEFHLLKHLHPVLLTAAGFTHLVAATAPTSGASVTAMSAPTLPALTHPAPVRRTFLGALASAFRSAAAPPASSPSSATADSGTGMASPAESAAPGSAPLLPSVMASVIRGREATAVAKTPQRDDSGGAVASSDGIASVGITERLRTLGRAFEVFERLVKYRRPCRPSSAAATARGPHRAVTPARRGLAMSPARVDRVAQSPLRSPSSTASATARSRSRALPTTMLLLSWRASCGMPAALDEAAPHATCTAASVARREESNCTAEEEEAAQRRLSLRARSLLPSARLLRALRRRPVCALALAEALASSMSGVAFGHHTRRPSSAGITLSSETTIARRSMGSPLRVVAGRADAALFLADKTEIAGRATGGNSAETAESRAVAPCLCHRCLAAWFARGPHGVLPATSSSATTKSGSATFRCGFKKSSPPEACVRHATHSGRTLGRWELSAARAVSAAGDEALSAADAAARSVLSSDEYACVLGRIAGQPRRESEAADASATASLLPRWRRLLRDLEWIREAGMLAATRVELTQILVRSEERTPKCGRKRRLWIVFEPNLRCASCPSKVVARACTRARSVAPLFSFLFLSQTLVRDRPTCSCGRIYPRNDCCRASG